ncbi:MAG: DUF1932 domain-containing protein [Sphingobium sp.]
MDRTIALIGFGEAAGTFACAAGWQERAKVFDVKTDAADTRDAMLGAFARAGVTGCDTVAAALAGADAVLSLVTADQSMAVAETVVASIAKDVLFLDMNSVAPQTKRAAAEIVEAAGGRYADVAVMAPVNPAKLDVPLLVSGLHAAAASDLLSGIGFTNIRVVGDEVGRASTIKMLRSVMYKGMEALTAECLIACERAGVTEDVLGSFGNDWSTGADYRLDRMIVHGSRRAAEMEEAVKTLVGLGVAPLMTRGTVQRQREIGSLGLSPVPDGLNAKLERLRP